MKRTGYQVRIVIEKFVYDSKIGSCERTIVERIKESVESPHAEWGMGDFDTLAQADRMVKAMVTIDK